jgi:hypothetical protein
LESRPPVKTPDELRVEAKKEEWADLARQRRLVLCEADTTWRVERDQEHTILHLAKVRESVREGSSLTFRQEIPAEMRISVQILNVGLTESRGQRDDAQDSAGQSGRAWYGYLFLGR